MGNVGTIDYIGVYGHITHHIGEAVTGVNYHLIDLGIAMEHVVLVAEEMELSTCWIGWFNDKKLKNILDIPRDWKVQALLTVGYADPQFKPKTRKRLAREKIFLVR